MPTIQKDETTGAKALPSHAKVSLLAAVLLDAPFYSTWQNSAGRM